jgi:hypothetical protein
MTLLIFFSSILTFTNLADTTNHSSVELQAIASDVGATPFFLSRLQYGAIPLDNPGIVAIVRNGKNYNLKKKYDWKYQVQATGWAGKLNDFWLTEAYVSGRRGNWELWAGRRKEVYGLGDTAMTSGFYAWSGNAVPIPKIQFGTRDYVDFAKGHLGIFMTFAHGWLDNQGPVLDGFLHQKTLYGRIGRRNALINLFGGVNHQVMWAGRSGSTTYGTGLNTLFYVAVPIKDREEIKVDPNAPWYETNYQYGAHLGSIDFLLEIQPEWGNISIYKQTAWETGRIAKLITANDGITGISIHLKRTKLLQHIIFEYIYTANQGQYYSGLAKLLGMKDPHANEIENNFNGTHGGWHYMDRGIGTPLVVYDLESKGKNGYYFSLNAVKAYYIGFQGILLNELYWKLKAAYSLHTSPKFPGFPIREYDGFIPQTSIGLQVSKNVFKNLNFQAEIGYDQGERVTNALGMKLGLKYVVN